MDLPCKLMPMDFLLCFTARALQLSLNADTMCMKGGQRKQALVCLCHTSSSSFNKRIGY